MSVTTTTTTTAKTTHTTIEMVPLLVRLIVLRSCRSFLFITSVCFVCFVHFVFGSRILQPIYILGTMIKTAKPTIAQFINIITYITWYRAYHTRTPCNLKLNGIKWNNTGRLLNIDIEILINFHIECDDSKSVTKIESLMSHSIQNCTKFDRYSYTSPRSLRNRKKDLTGILHRPTQFMDSKKVESIVPIVAVKVVTRWTSTFVRMKLNLIFLLIQKCLFLKNNQAWSYIWTNLDGWFSRFYSKIWLFLYISSGVKHTQKDYSNCI